MKRLSYSNSRSAIISIAIGLLALALYVIYGLSIYYLSAALGLVGFGFGVLSVKTKAGAIGVGLNVLAILGALYVLVLWFSYNPR